MANYKSGDIVRLTRLAIGMTQETLSEGICSVETLSRIENGKHKIKRDTYERLMARMERQPERNYAVCTGENMELLEERDEMEAAFRQSDFEKVELCLLAMKKKISVSTLNHQYIMKAEALLHYYTSKLTAEALVEQIEAAVQLTIPDYKQHLDDNYPFAQHEIIALMNLANSYSKLDMQERSIEIYKMLLRSLDAEYMTDENRSVLKIKIMRNYAKTLGELEMYQCSNELLFQCLDISRKYDYGELVSIALSDIAWNTLKLVACKEENAAELSLVKRYLRQGYYIAVARNDSKIAKIIEQFYASQFDGEIRIG